MLIGIVVGFIPSIGGVAAMALLLPFTYTMSPASAIALLLGMLAIVQTSSVAFQRKVDIFYRMLIKG